MEELLRYLDKNKVISTKEAGKILNSPRQVSRLESRGILTRVGPKGCGYFSHPSIEPGDAYFIILSKYYPQCVVSGKTALALYGLGQQYFDQIDVDISKETNLRNSLFHVHRVHPRKIFNYRTKKIKTVPIKIKIYTPERCLYEAYKFGDRSEVYIKAIKRYRKNYLKQNNPSQQYAIINNIDKKLNTRILRDVIMDDVDE